MPSSEPRFDIAPFSLPDCAPGEVRFEEPRDVSCVAIDFNGEPPAAVGLSYLKRHWLTNLAEDPLWSPTDRPFGWGWFLLDDHFTASWQAAAATTERRGREVLLRFAPLSRETRPPEGYDPSFRRTLGLRVEVADPRSVAAIRVYTVSPCVQTRLFVELDAGRPTDTDLINLSGYNCRVDEVIPGSGVHAAGTAIATVRDAGKRSFFVSVSHMEAPGPVNGDAGLLTFDLGYDAFTVSLAMLAEEGPVWYEREGVFITRAAAPVPFDEYRATRASRRNIAALVASRREQSFSGARLGQPRPHVENTSFPMGCGYARQAFRVSANGDVLLDHFNAFEKCDPSCRARFKNSNAGHDGWWPPRTARFFFGLELWSRTANHSDPAPVMAYNVAARLGALLVEQKSFAVPLDIGSVERGITGDADIVALVRFRFTNAGADPQTAVLPIEYSQCARRTEILGYKDNLVNTPQDDFAVPRHDREPLSVEADRVYGAWQDGRVLRCVCRADGARETVDGKVVLSRALAPGETWEVVLKIPFVALESPEELSRLDSLDFGKSYEIMARYWRRRSRAGASIRTPVPQINDLHAFSLPHLEVADFAATDGSGLIHSSTGGSTYKDYPKETVLMAHSLDERGLHEEARRRYGVWLRYQGTKPLTGTYSDHRGVFFGSGGFEGMGYNQHHGWVLWGLTEHLLLTGDREWFRGIAPAVLEGAEWVIRQRRRTMGSLPHSRGWERGFLPAGALEDVEDFNYWVSTNVLTWRGLSHAARGLALIGHPEAHRIQREADEYAADLKRGLETMRRASPLVRLRDGRWVPHYPSRVYRRGRDVGWVREVYEGALFLLISGLYDPTGEEAGWICDDYHDNLTARPPYGYPVPDYEANWFFRGGACQEPNFFPDVLPFLERDQPEVYVWMFFNAWCFVWEEELCGMAEHPAPLLGWHNLAMFKQSEEIAALTWLHYMFVWPHGRELHFGRAIPREWLRREVYAEGVSTPFGDAGVRYSPRPGGGLAARVDLALREAPGRIVVRFRHPEKRLLASVRVNGAAHHAFDAVAGDVDITGCSGVVEIEADF